ncbi:uncharacterized protein VTP21DRAFT_334 [Calcarisporiella thermophila]|uniref:uncharacterized protein n=1 Tax=Calcarisporiella thermophila TaxID=911321 RepID=UPI0037447386
MNDANILIANGRGQGDTKEGGILDRSAIGRASAWDRKIARLICHYGVFHPSLCCRQGGGLALPTSTRLVWGFETQSTNYIALNSVAAPVEPQPGLACAVTNARPTCIGGGPPICFPGVMHSMIQAQPPVQ